MRITRPQDMAPDLSMFENAVKLFEEQDGFIEYVIKPIEK